MRNTSLLLFILFLIGCAAIPYEESKVEIINVNQQIIQLDIFDSQFEKFLKSQGYSTLDLPLKQWSLQEEDSGKFYTAKNLCQKLMPLKPNIN